MNDDPGLRITHHPSFDQTLGIEYERITPDEVVASVEVGEQLLGQAGSIHGGVLSTLAESAASLGTVSGVAREGKIALGQSISTSILKPIKVGTVTAVARRVEGGPDRWVWSIEMRDSGGEVSALSTMTVAVRSRAS